MAKSLRARTTYLCVMRRGKAAGRTSARMTVFPLGSGRSFAKRSLTGSPCGYSAEQLKRCQPQPGFTVCRNSAVSIPQSPVVELETQRWIRNHICTASRRSAAPGRVGTPLPTHRVHPLSSTQPSSGLHSENYPLSTVWQVRYLPFLYVETIDIIGAIGGSLNTDTESRT